MKTKHKYYDGPIPFDANIGNPMVYPHPKQYQWTYQGETFESYWALKKEHGDVKAEQVEVGPVWKPNKMFVSANLVVKAIHRGRSASQFHVEDAKTGVIYTMFMADMLDVMQGSSITAGVIQHTQWIFCKRGSNYGLKMWRG